MFLIYAFDIHCITDYQNKLIEFFQKNSYWGKIHLGVLDNPKNTISNGNAILVKEMI